MSCKRKASYRHRTEAIAALRTIKYSGGGKRPVRPTRPYLCDCCGRWHLTSMPVRSAA